MTTHVDLPAPSRRVFLLGASMLALAACATATPYQPATGSSDGGYSNQRLTDNRWRVTFSGNSLTSRQTVENYLLYRAAELTQQQGYDWFVTDERNTHRDRRTFVDRPFGPGPYGYWGPSWRYRRSRFGWRTWNPGYGDPFWGDQFDVHTIDRYEASAEIVMRRGALPADNPRAFDAKQVLQTLGPQIQRPT